MNHERQPEIPKFILNLGEEKVVCTPENTLAFLYENKSYDHIFHITSQEEDTMYGFHIFRHLLGNDFDILVRRMIDGGYAVSNEEEITKSDFEAYQKSLPVEAHYQELTPRQERLVDFLAYILEKEHLVAEDFNGKNELYI